MTGTKRRVAVFVSGRGSNMRALAAAASAPAFPAEIVAVFSNDPEAPGLVWAAEAGLQTFARSHRPFKAREDFDRIVDAELRQREVDLVCLAGFMRLLSPWFVDLWAGRMINIHPSLLPSFRGLDTHARAIEAGVRIHGCTVHFVVPEVDAGPIIGQAAVRVRDDDTPETLGARVLAQEHVLYPMALERVASGTVRLTEGRIAGAGISLLPPVGEGTRL